MKTERYQLIMAVGNSKVTFTLHETCRTCLMNIEMQPIPIFSPEMILNEFSLLKLKVTHSTCDNVSQEFNFCLQF